MREFIINPASIQNVLKSRGICEELALQLSQDICQAEEAFAVCRVHYLFREEPTSQLPQSINPIIFTMDATGASSHAHGHETLSEKNAKHFE